MGVGKIPITLSVLSAKQLYHFFNKGNICYTYGLQEIYMRSPFHNNKLSTKPSPCSFKSRTLPIRFFVSIYLCANRYSLVKFSSI